MMRVRHMNVRFCWVPSHINIAGNEKAGQLAKEGAAMEGEAGLMHYPYRDFYPIIKKLVSNYWQEQWYNMDNNKLRAIKDHIKTWHSAKNKSRKFEIGMSRLRIGHTKLTHDHLMEGRAAPLCDSCIVPLTVKHIMAECSDYNLQRQLIFHSRILTLEEIIGEQPRRRVKI